MPVETLSQNKGLRLIHPKGASAEVLFYGATVISWKSILDGDDAPAERLFVSSKAFLDGSKPVRGGIPVVFPFFGPPTKPEHSKLPQHGYARNAMWTWNGQVVMDNDAGVSVKLTFKPDATLTQDTVELAYVITLAEHQLSTDLHVKNASPTNALTFQALLHTYIRAPSKSLHIDGLSQLNYTDKTQTGAPRLPEQRAVVDVLKFTDSVYEDGPQEHKVTWPEGGMKIKAIGFKDVVVWNPNVEASAKLSDMEEGGWEKFVCVEPGYVKEFFDLAPGQTWIGGQTLTPFKASTSQL